MPLDIILPAFSVGMEDGAIALIPVPKAKKSIRDGIIASPLARRVAAQNGLDLSMLVGSGPGGRLIEEDVLQAMKTSTAKAPTP